MSIDFCHSINKIIDFFYCLLYTKGKEAKKDNRMKNRIHEVRTTLGITQQAMADQLGLKRNTVGAYEIGAVNPSDRTISDICRIYNVNEVWLRTGEGEMFTPRTREEEIAAFFGDLLSGNAPEIKQRLVFVLANLPGEAWPGVEMLCKRIADEFNDKKDPAEGQGQ